MHSVNICGWNGDHDEKFYYRIANLILIYYFFNYKLSTLLLIKSKSKSRN